MLTPLFLQHSNKGEGLPQYTQLYVSSRSIKMLPLFPFHPSLPLIHICSAANPSNAVSPSLLSLHPCRLPSHPLSLSLPLARCTGDVILFQLDSPPFSLLPRSHSALRFPLVAGSSQRSILSMVASSQGWEGEEECRREV